MPDAVTWAHVARMARDTVSDSDVDVARRALDYLCLAQLYLRSNPRLSRSLRPEDLKPSPRGHWGVCPPVNAVLAALGPLDHVARGRVQLQVIHGAGHANASALGHAYLTGALGEEDPAFAQSPSGLLRLIDGFPHVERFGGEITPLIPNQSYMGGQLGLALPVAQGMALDAPSRLVVPLIGDGECETGATAAAWLGGRTLAESSPQVSGLGQHGSVLPVVLLNGQRMGGASLLAGLSTDELAAYFAGLGYVPVTADGRDTGELRDALEDCLRLLCPLDDGPSAVLLVTLPKGYGAPVEVGGCGLLGTPRVHKTPLREPAQNPGEFEALETWLRSYRPAEVIGVDGTPSPGVRCALGRPTPPVAATTPSTMSEASSIPCPPEADFGLAISAVLRRLHSETGLRVFSPDELRSNRIDAAPGPGEGPWVTEILNEELCHAWAQGYVETGRPAVVITYEGFAPVVTSALVQHLKYRSLARAADRSPTPSLVYLLTSLSWENTCTHANPGLVVSALATADPSLRLLTPADAERTAAALSGAVRDAGTCTLITKGKHSTATWPAATFAQEVRDGCAIWPHLSDDGCDIVLAAAGDIAVEQLAAAAHRIRRDRPRARVRFVAIHDLTCLGTPTRWPRGLPPERFDAIFPPGRAVLLVTATTVEAPGMLLRERLSRATFHLRGYRDPGRPMTPPTLLATCRMDTATLVDDAITLLDARENRWTA